MIEVVKRTLFAGLGAAVVTKEVLDGALREWVEKGKITPEEAGVFSDRLVGTGKARWEETRDAFAARLEEGMAAANLATRARIEALEARVALIELRGEAEKKTCDVGGA